MCFAECFLFQGCVTTEYISEVVVAGQCSVFFGAKRLTENNTGEEQDYIAMQLYPLITLINLLYHRVILCFER